MIGGPAQGVALFVRFRSELPPEELTRRYKERLPDFQALPGLIQKYYVQDPGTDEIGGIYIWDSQESLTNYLQSDLRKTIAGAYEVVGEPRVERLEIIDRLRD